MPITRDMDRLEDEKAAVRRTGQRQAAVIVAVLALGAGAIATLAGPGTLSALSKLFGFRLDLASCADWFARPLLAGSLLVAMLAPICLIFSARSLFSAYHVNAAKDIRGAAWCGAACAVLIIMLAVGDTGLWTDGGRQISYIPFSSACALGDHVFYLRVWVGLAAVILFGYAGLAIGLIIPEFAGRGWSMRYEGTDAKRIAAQQALDDMRRQRLSPLTITKRIGAFLKWGFTAVILFFLAFALPSLNFTYDRAYVHFHWEHTPATVISVGMSCSIQRNIARSNTAPQWREESKSACSPTERDTMLSEIAAATDHVRRQLHTEPLYRAKVTRNGSEGFVNLPPYYAPDGAKVGDEIDLLANPHQPGVYLRTFNADEVWRTIFRIATISLALLAIYLMHFRRRPTKGSTPPSTFGRPQPRTSPHQIRRVLR